MNILCLNAGSSSLKYKLFAMPDETVLAEGVSEHGGGNSLVSAAQEVIAQCQPLKIEAVAHRVVHGGPRFFAPTRMTPETLQTLRELEPLDPLHNPSEVAIIEASQAALPDVPNVALFDTAFHQTLPEIAWRYALPTNLADRRHLRRYGFHGLSHRFVSEQFLKCLGRDAKGTRLIVCHLGSGASVCALKDGQSVDTSMGLTPLEGLVMGTRSGDIDPGLLLYLLRTQPMTADELDELLNHQSGLQGLSGRSGDTRELEKTAAEGDARSELALAIFAYHVRKYIGAYAAALGGLDGLAFTGGIGEHSAQMRTRICRDLVFLGLHVDESRNAALVNEPAPIGAEAATVPIWVIPTDEERQMARETYAFLQPPAF